ncbi:thymidine phosphorylase [Ktedonobacter racemifer]|uniref:Pyrimidine-nucleoside phosphorylase n=1 Tax=Ktedonobacter racemifer DSM 44963 TaxID=485913 RepID=D6TFN7_KTERA|nr:thymidine phosphorylase [Ktedonobacter racemifer]EFH90520.1 pyrimidine-nucleoside phosphorylase [Ktedonobacter racemifer DSM 44963]
MQAVELIRKKRDGGVLDTDEINWLIEQYTQGAVPDYQMAAWLMAVCWRGMDARETRDLTMAMVHSGDELHVRDIVSPVIDKHSTGGVGDKVTLAVAPLAAACGIAVGKMTGRGLGHTGGTVDKLESVQGFRPELTREEFIHILKTEGVVLAGQSADLAPADGKMYALRDVTGTVESIPLIAASIMSKKLAIGCSHLLLDVKFGSGAFMKTVEKARELAQAMVDIGRLAGIHTVAALTSMEQPLGCAVGNALEMMEAIAILRGEGPEDVSELCYHDVAELLVMTGKAQTMDTAEQQVQQAIRSGAGLAKLAAVIAAQGGDARQVEQPHLLPQAPYKVMLTSPHTGYIAAIDAEAIGLASMRLGAGRFRKGEPVDHRTGLVLQAKVGAYRQAGEPLVEVHARSEAEARDLFETLLACYRWSDTPVQPGALIHEVIRP